MLLTEEENDGIIVEDRDRDISETESHRWLIGKLFTKRIFNKEATIATMKIIWKLAKTVEIMVLGENLFLLNFFMLADKNKVLDGAPWSFDKHLFMLHDYEAGLKLEDYIFSNLTMWVRVYDLPLEMRNHLMAMKIGWKIGNLIAMDACLET
ncbi:hypothetical protein REPUB_Repub16aG0019700 [Reevesia pubescens]